jgi:hypothetical protein
VNERANGASSQLIATVPAAPATNAGVVFECAKGRISVLGQEICERGERGRNTEHDPINLFDAAANFLWRLDVLRGEIGGDFLRGQPRLGGAGLDANLIKRKLTRGIEHQHVLEGELAAKRWPLPW